MAELSAPPAASPATEAPSSRVIDQHATVSLATGKSRTGRLEHFFGSKVLVIFDEDSLEPIMLSVTAKEAPAEHAALEPDQVLLRNWTELRGAAEALQEQGVILLTGQEVRVGMFGLQAFVARVL